MKRKVEKNPIRLFERWYVRPLRDLEKLPDGDGGFVVLATCCFLYERYAKAYLQDSGEKASDENLIDQFARDFAIQRNAARAFWDVIRNGFLHQGMPKARARDRTSLPGWRTHHAFLKPIDLISGKAQEELQIQPWLFRDRVFELYQARPDLIAYDKNFPWGVVVEPVEDAAES